MASGVEFEEDKFSYKPPSQVQTGFSSRPAFSAPTGQVNINRNDPKMVQWLMRKGLANSPASAQAILLVVIIINLAITYSIIKYIL